MNEDKIFEMTKLAFEDVDKDTIIEYLSALTSKLIASGVNIGDCQLEPDYIEYVDDNGYIQRMPGRLGNRPIWDTLTLNFANHDANIRKEVEDAEFHKEIEELQWRNAKCQKEIAAKQYEIDKLKTENDELKSENAELHCEMQAMCIFPDEIPTEPIKVADMLISAEGEYERHPIAKAICGTDKGTYRIFDVADLRQIAEHLLVYCNHNEGVQG